MIYWATRETKAYLDKLWHFRNTDNRVKDVVTVAGGMAFLHFLNESVASLTILDRDQDALDYNKYIVSTIKEIPLLADFQTKIRTEQANLEGDVHVHFEGPIVLDKYHFNWLFGQYGFTDQDTYNTMRESLLKTTITFSNTSFETFNYNIGTNPLYTLISNSDSLYFTHGDIIIKQIRSTAPGEVVYISWFRTHYFYNNQHHKDTVEKIRPHTKGRSVIEIPTLYGFSFTPAELSVSTPQVITRDIGRIQAELAAGKRNTVLIHISWTKEQTEGKLRELLSTVIPNATRIVYIEWTAHLTAAKFVQMFTDLQLNASYRLSSLEWAGGTDSCSRSFIAVMDLLGS